MSCSYQFFRFSHDLFLKKSDQTSHLGCELVAGLFESEGDRLLSLLLLELLPPSPPVLLPVQEEANTWAWFAYWAVLLKKTIVHYINHFPSYLVESRLYEPSETSGPTNGDRSSSLRIATGPSCKRFNKHLLHSCPSLSQGGDSIYLHRQESPLKPHQDVGWGGLG